MFASQCLNVELENLSTIDHGPPHRELSDRDALVSGSPVKQYALTSILIVLGALVAVNFVSSRVERERVISRLET